MEPLPKQGCEEEEERKHAELMVSVEPLPKQGCEGTGTGHPASGSTVSVEPLPKQGCELVEKVVKANKLPSLSGTPAEAGVRAVNSCSICSWKQCLSGTPAEAGVRVDTDETVWSVVQVSVEPLPKQGCEVQWRCHSAIDNGSQWNPCRSRGASPEGEKYSKLAEASQWNPCRSRGARTRQDR